MEKTDGSGNTYYENENSDHIFEFVKNEYLMEEHFIDEPPYKAQKLEYIKNEYANAGREGATGTETGNTILFRIIWN